MDQGKETAFSSASRPMKYALSGAVFYCTFSLGIFATALNPAVNDFAIKFDTSVDKVSIIFTVSLVSYLVGALLGGVVFNSVNRQVIVVFLLAIASAALFVYPHVTSLAIFFVTGGVIGFVQGGYDTAQVAWIIDIWRHEAGPFILCQHFAYSVGTLVPPLVFAPFLTGDTGEGDSWSTTTTVPAESSTYFLSMRNETEKAPSSELFVPFTISGCLGLVAVLIQIVIYFVLRRLKKTRSDSNEGCNNTNPEKNPHQVVVGADGGGVITPTGGKPYTSLWDRIRNDDLLRRKLFVIFLACCYIGFYQAMELTTMQFLSLFAQKSKINLSEKEGARVLLGLNIGFAVFRAVGIPVVLKVRPQYILACNFTLVFIGNTLLLVLGGSSRTWLWVGSVCLGVGFSTMYPAFYAYLEKYLFVDDTVAATITVCGGLVAAIYPLIVGGFVEENPTVLNYVDYVSFVITLAAFVTLFWFTKRKAADHVSPKDH